MSERGTEQVCVRLPSHLLRRLEALLPRIGAAPELATVGRPNRSDVIRLALLRGAAQLEAEFGGQEEAR